MTSASTLTKSLVLILGILLGLSHLSCGQNWPTFQSKHIINTTTVDCQVVDSSLYYIKGGCRSRNTFITAIQSPATVKSLCNRYIGRNCFLTTPAFRLIECNLEGESRQMPPCSYTAAAPVTSVICIVCDNQDPVHFENTGRCNKPPENLC